MISNMTDESINDSKISYQKRNFEDLPKVAQRALREAQERREKGKTQEMPREVGGRGGKDPARYGDWEIDGRAIDF